MSVVSSVCCYCGTGCGVLIEADAGKITGVRGDPAHPANGLPRRRVGWDVALDHAAEEFSRVIREHGPDAASGPDGGDGGGAQGVVAAGVWMTQPPSTGLAVMGCRRAALRIQFEPSGGFNG